MTISPHSQEALSIPAIDADEVAVDYQEISRLFSLVAASDEAAFQEVYRRFEGMVYSIVQQVLINPEDAEDVVQEVFAQLWKKAELYTEGRGKPTTWLATLARNKAIDRFRSKHRRNRLNDEFERDPEKPKGWQAPSPAVATETIETATEVRSVVLQLPAEQRLAIQLAYFEGLTQVEIAERTGAPIGTVKARIRRGLGRLRGMLEGFQFVLLVWWLSCNQWRG
jgi:RNA polymerase sigma-70 factor (ECF subfamily)